MHFSARIFDWHSGTEKLASRSWRREFGFKKWGVEKWASRSWWRCPNALSPIAQRPRRPAPCQGPGPPIAHRCNPLPGTLAHPRPAPATPPAEPATARPVDHRADSGQRTETATAGLREGHIEVDIRWMLRLRDTPGGNAGTSRVISCPPVADLPRGCELRRRVRPPKNSPGCPHRSERPTCAINPSSPRRPLVLPAACTCRLCAGEGPA